MLTIVALWIVWSVLAVLLFGFILYRHYLIHYQEARPASADGTASPPSGDAKLAKAAYFQHIIRILGGIEGLATLTIAGYYVLDAMRQI